MSDNRAEWPRIPPRQRVTQKFPALTYGDAPHIQLADWQIKVTGLVEKDLALTWDDLRSLPETKCVSDFHCVTLWSRLDNEWEGVRARDLLSAAGLRPEGRHAMVRSYGGFSTNLELHTLLKPDVMLAWSHNGSPLTPEHGWPLRLVVPSRYGWKSAKWVREIEVLEAPAPGFWEQRGFHMNADPWQEQRFWDEIPLDLGLSIALCSDKL